jgi:hypothetical protein
MSDKVPYLPFLANAVLVNRRANNWPGRIPAGPAEDPLFTRYMFPAHAFIPSHHILIYAP